ncbi:MAG: hypothetical protein FWG99_00755 [Treponema sp.]|nr:hypothetical protein [Treponema sp.]
MRVKILLKTLLLVFLLLPVGIFAEPRFGTWSGLGLETQFDSKTMEPKQVFTEFKGIVKFTFDPWEGVNIFTELSMAGSQDLYLNKDLTGRELYFSDGLKHFFVDALTNPIQYWGNTLPKVDHLKLTYSSDYVVTDIGYKYTKLPEHTNALWKTISSDWDAGWDEAADYGGFVALTTGSGVPNIGPVGIRAQAIPNKSADRRGEQYGFLGWIAATYESHVLDFQYNGAYGKEGWETVFDDIYEADFILGYTSKFGGLGISSNLLLNLWGVERKVSPGGTRYRDFYTPSPGSSDVGTVDPDAETLENMAAGIRLFYDFSAFNAGKAFLGYRFRGSQANMMYVKEADGATYLSDQLGPLNTQRFWLDYELPPLADGLTIGFGAGPEFILYRDGRIEPYNNPDNILIRFNPWFRYDLKQINVNAVVSPYAEMSFYTAEEDHIMRGNIKSPFLLSKVGILAEIGQIHREIRGVDLHIGVDNRDRDYLYNSWLATIKMREQLNIQGGFLLRIANNNVETHDNPFGFFMGVTKRLSTPVRPTVYAQFMWNMEPYKSFTDGITFFDLDGSLMNGTGDYSGSAAVRLGLRWEL